MHPILVGLIAGTIFGVVDVLLMVPLKLPDKRRAMVGAFFSRFAIGFLIPLLSVPEVGWLRGLMVGLLVSLPDAIITKAYAPIMATGTVGGAVIGLLVV